MHLSKHLLNLVNSDLGEGTYQDFLPSFKAIGYEGHYNKPLLENDPAHHPLEIANGRIDWPKVKYISFENNSSEETQLKLQITPPQTQNVDELFHFFAEITAHSHWLADFREVPNYSAYILSKQNYFLLHGDGNCLLLSLLLSAMVENLCGYKIDVKFCSNEQGSFSHVYCLDEKTGRIYDIDQKSILNAKTLRSDDHDILPLLGLMYWLIMHGGVVQYREIKASSEPLLADVTHNYFNTNFEIRDPARVSRIYQPQPRQNHFFALWEDANKHLCETIAMDSQDYPWKTTFSKALSNQDVGKLLGQAFEPMSISIPAGGVLSVGFSKDLETVEEIKILAHIFHGRTPMCLSLPSGQTSVQLFDMPWMILCPVDLTSITINNNDIKTTKTRCGNYSYIGMKDFEAMGLFDAEEWLVNLDFANCDNSALKIIYPANAFALNSSFLSSEFSGGVKCALSKM